MENNFHLDWLSFSYNPTLYKDVEFEDNLGNPYPAVSGEEIDLFVHDCLAAFLFRFPFFTRIIEDFSWKSKTRFYDNTVNVSFDGEDTHFIIQWDNVYSNKGVNISIPATYLKESLEYIFQDLHGSFNDGKFIGCENLQLIFKQLEKSLCKVSRIDLAYDDYSKAFTPYWYEVKYMNNCIVTRKSTHSYVSSKSGAGDTFYLGSRRNGTLLRIYDKAYESKGELDCIRYEFEFTQQMARNIMDEVLKLSDEELKDFSPLFFTSLLQTFILRVNDEESSDLHNRSRLKGATEWQNWVDSLKNQIFNRYIEIPTSKKKDVSEESRREFYWKTYFPKVANLCFDNPSLFLDKLIDYRDNIYGKDNVKEYLKFAYLDGLYTEDELDEYFEREKKIQQIFYV